MNLVTFCSTWSKVDASTTLRMCTSGTLAAGTCRQVWCDVTSWVRCAKVASALTAPELPFGLQALYPLSTSSEGSYRDPVIVDTIDEHNSQA